MTTLKLNDSVELLRDVPERNLSKGAQGTVVFVFSKPRAAYEVEFVAEDGSTVAELALESDAIRGLPSNRSKHRSSGVIVLATKKSATVVRLRKDSGSLRRDKESGRSAETRRGKRKVG
jgi:Domain of unknown function (DUF4926)